MDNFNIDIGNAYTLIVDKLENWVEITIKMIPNLIIAIIVLLAFVLIGRLSRKLAYRIFDRAVDNYSLKRLLGKLVYVLVILVGLFVALSVLKLDGTVTSLLAGAGVVGLALAFAFKEIASDYISGTMMSIQKPFRENDLIKTNDYTGRVKAIHIRTTHLETLQGQYVMIPNSDVFKNAVVNYTKTGKRRVDLEVRVPYEADLKKAKEIALREIKSIEGVEEKDVSLYYMEFGRIGVEFKVRYWIAFGNSNAEYWDKTDKGIIAIQQAFKEVGITIPHLSLDLDDGEVEGK